MILLILFLITPLKLNLPYHAHSFNAIPLIRQQVLKGVRSFKLDVSHAEIETCRKYTKNKDYSIDEVLRDDVMGCLALRGDAANYPYFDYDFDTTEDLLGFLRSEEFKEILEKTDSSIFFELDFKTYGGYIDLERRLLFDFLFKLYEVLEQ